MKKEINISEPAKKRIQDLFANDPNAINKSIRISLKENSLQYILSYDDQNDNDYKISISENYFIIVEKNLYDNFLTGAIVDWKKGTYGYGFSIKKSKTNAQIKEQICNP